MSTFIIDLSIGATLRVRVEAEDEAAARDAGRAYFVEDWETAGVRLFDVRIDSITKSGAIAGAVGADASLVVGPTGDSWTFATDDPYGRGDE